LASDGLILNFWEGAQGGAKIFTGGLGPPAPPLLKPPLGIETNAKQVAPVTADLAWHPTAGCCHLAIWTTWSKSHCLSIVNVCC